MRPALLLAALVPLGCASSAEYACPDPVGQIIRDDCEAYKTKYETLKVELGASLGPLGAKIAAGEQSLRDPSELLQVLAHRTFTLCRDFNACRVMPLEYRQRREQTDCIFTAVTAIQSQLKESLDAESKARLVKELTRVLAGETCGAPVTATPAAARARRPKPRGTYYFSSTPWFGTRLLPPQPDAAEGFPRLVSARFNVVHVFRDGSVIGYRPRAYLELLGKASPDDVITVDWGGASSDCNPRSGRNDLVAASCEAPEKLALTGASVSIKVTYRRGADGESRLIGERRAAVLIRQEKDRSPQYGVSHEDRVGQGLLIFRPEGRYVPPEAERAHLFIVLRVRKHDWSGETMRCWVNDKLVTKRAVEGRQGHVGQFQDLPRYRKVGRGSSRAVAEPFVYWRSVDYPLPFLVKRDAPLALSKGDRAWPEPGDWRCVAVVNGEPVRELRFTVRPDGRLEALPGQTERPRAAWLVQTRVLDNPVETTLGRE